MISSSRSERQAYCRHAALSTARIALPAWQPAAFHPASFTDEAAFDEFRKTLTWEGHAEKIRCPYLCLTGEADALSPLVHTERMMAARWFVEASGRIVKTPLEAG
jgi:hypothetical protein